MAKATAPLFAIEASGQIGKTVVYDRRGFVRIYTVPSNPKTAAQKNIRCQFSAIAAAVKATGNHATTAIKDKAQIPYRWSAEAIGAALKNDRWTTNQEDFADLEATDKTAWDNAANALGIQVNAESPCFPTALSGHEKGFTLYAYTRGLLQMGVTTDSSNDTPSDWQTFLSAN